MTRYPFTNSAPSAPAVRRMLERAYPRAQRASLMVHPDDDMFAFGLAAIGSETLSALAYFRAGASMMDVIERVAIWRFGSLDNVGSFLDFAAGYGRSSRFLVKYLSPDRVTVGEIQPDALEFQAHEFGVSTLQSTSDPAALTATRRFDFIFVASLFTHLPRATFGPWLAKLWELVAPGGVLVFSVHDEVLDRHDADWEDGFAFLLASEVAALDEAQYGTNFTTEAFVRAQLAEWIGPAADDAVRLPRGLCFEQDLWVITRGPRNEAPLIHESGPNGTLDRLDVDVNGHDFRLTGWAADTGFAEPGAVSHRIARVEVSFWNGTVVDAELGLPHVRRSRRIWGVPATRCSRPAAGRRAAAAPAGYGLGTSSRSPRSASTARRFVLDSTRIIDIARRTGTELSLTPMERRALTAETVLGQRGPAGLVELVPTVARNEWRRLGRKLRTANGGVRQG